MASVLVVEDDQFVRSALIRHLTDASHTVRSVGTALEALREVAHFRFDVVILDLGLPDLDGAEALKMLRGITDVPVIIATARDDETEIVRLLNDGADDYLTKPFSVPDIETNDRERWEARERDKWNVPAPGGESYAMVAVRAATWFSDLRHETVAIGPAPSGEFCAGCIRDCRGRRWPRWTSLKAWFSVCSRVRSRESSRLWRLAGLTIAGRDHRRRTCRTTASGISSASPHSARAMGPRSAVWSTAARRAFR